jgi:hypothetical protein
MVCGIMFTKKLHLIGLFMHSLLKIMVALFISVVPRSICSMQESVLYKHGLPTPYRYDVVENTSAEKEIVVSLYDVVILQQNGLTRTTRLMSHPTEEVQAYAKASNEKFGSLGVRRCPNPDNVWINERDYACLLTWAASYQKKNDLFGFETDITICFDGIISKSMLAQGVTKWLIKQYAASEAKNSALDE